MTWRGIKHSVMAAGLGLLFLPSSWARDKGPDCDAERARLKGTWQLVFAESEGKVTPPDQIKDVRVEIGDRSHSVFFGDREIAHEVPSEIDTTASPRATDDTLIEGPDRGKKIRGIYRLDDDSLVSCVAKPGAERPTEFAAGPGSGHTLRVFLRVRPDEKPERKAARAEAMRFNGTWRFHEFLLGGNKLPDEALNQDRLILQGNQFLSVNPRGTLHGHYVVQPHADPKEIDVIFTDGPTKGLVMRGIYELTEDTYKVCFELNGKERPKAFESKPGTRQVLEILKREPANAP